MCVDRKRKFAWLSLLAFLWVLLATGAFPHIAYAKELPENGQGIYIRTRPVPEEAIAYAQKYGGERLSARHEDLDDLELGSPFMVCSDTNGSMTAYFPILKGGAIIHMLQVYELPTGGYGCTLTDWLNGYFISLSGKTSQTEPVCIFVNNDNVIAIQKGQVRVLQPDHEGKPVTVAGDFIPEGEQVVVNCKEVLPYTKTDASATAQKMAHWRHIGYITAASLLLIGAVLFLLYRLAIRRKRA